MWPIDLREHWWQLRFAVAVWACCSTRWGPASVYVQAIIVVRVGLSILNTHNILLTVTIVLNNVGFGDKRNQTVIGSFSNCPSPIQFNWESFGPHDAVAAVASDSKRKSMLPKTWKREEAINTTTKDARILG